VAKFVVDKFPIDHENVFLMQLYQTQYFEKCVLDQPIGAESKSETARFSKKSESGTIRLIRTTSKCLARGADDKSGCFADFRTFINMTPIKNWLIF
jgi:hypothetical protein